MLLLAAVVADLLQGPGGLRPSKPNFSGVDLAGRGWKLGEHRGRHPVIVSFFATWCGPCRMEIPHLVELEKKYADRGLEVVMVTKEPAETVKADPELSVLPLRILVDGERIFTSYNVSPIPHLFYFDAEGSLVEDVEGYDEDALARVESHLKSAPARQATARASR
jgi:thiol-disulfide isomerase/thioredoxin